MSNRFFTRVWSCKPSDAFTESAKRKRRASTSTTSQTPSTNVSLSYAGYVPFLPSSHRPADDPRQRQTTSLFLRSTHVDTAKESKALENDIAASGSKQNGKSLEETIEDEVRWSFLCRFEQLLIPACTGRDRSLPLRPEAPSRAAKVAPSSAFAWAFEDAEEATDGGGDGSCCGDGEAERCGISWSCRRRKRRFLVR